MEETTRESTGTKSRLLRTPPQNLDAERALLGAIILKSEVMHDVSVTVYPESFYADKHREIYRAILDTFMQGDPIDILSITTKLKARSLLVAQATSPNSSSPSPLPVMPSTMLSSYKINQFSVVSSMQPMTLLKLAFQTQRTSTKRWIPQRRKSTK